MCCQLNEMILSAACVFKCLSAAGMFVLAVCLFAMQISRFVVGQQQVVIS